jgi:hypothetical protein
MGIWEALGFRRSVSRVTVEGGKPFYHMYDPKPVFKTEVTNADKIRLALTSPGAFTVFKFVADMFSQGQFKLYPKGGIDAGADPVEDHSLLEFLKSPNILQSQTQFLWDYMFCKKVYGTANLYVDSWRLEMGPRAYFLANEWITWPEWFEQHRRTLILSEEKLEEGKETILKYNEGRVEREIPYANVYQWHDVTSAFDRWHSPSVLDAYFKVVQNSDLSVRSKNVNANFAGKFLVGSQVDVENTSEIPMGPMDKATVRKALNSKESIFPTLTPPNIERFVPDGNILSNLDESFRNDVSFIGHALNIPKDALEILAQGATYENQEKAKGSFTAQSLQMDADDFCEGILKAFGIDEQYEAKMSWDHLPHNQVFEKQKAEMLKQKADAFSMMIEAGVAPEAAARILNWEIDEQEFREPYFNRSRTNGTSEEEGDRRREDEETDEGED